jgi:hypothetical protein
MTTFADRVYQLGGVPLGGPVTQGKVFHVRPSGGRDSTSGKNPGDQALKTLSRALALATANQNDIVYLMSEGNAASACTDYQTTTLEWSKDGVHLIGVNAGGMVSPRSRVAWLSTASSASDIPLYLHSADNCLVEGVQFFSGINDANLSFNVKVTGHRNVFRRCHFAGIGHDTNDATGAYSLCLSGGTENLFEDCIIGLDTIARGSAVNSEILFDASGSADCNARNIFRNCIILTYAEAATHQFVIRESAGSDRFNLFEGCTFLNAVPGLAMTEALDITAGGSPSGALYFKDCAFFGVGDLEAAAVSGVTYALGHAVAAGDNSLGAAVAAS